MCSFYQAREMPSGIENCFFTVFRVCLVTSLADMEYQAWNMGAASFTHEKLWPHFQATLASMP